MCITIYPGSFDPITNGHLDILKNSLNFSKKIYCSIGYNSKKEHFFTIEERKKIILQVIRESFTIKEVKKISITSFNGLLINYAKKIGASIIIRGLRNGTDLNHEMQIASMNNVMAPNITTIFLTSNISVRFISSTLIRQILKLNGNISYFVPKFVVNFIKKRSSK